MSVLIKNAKVLTQDPERRVFDGDVLIEDNRIKEVSSKSIVAEAEWKIEGKGKILMPGLVNLHTHLPMGLLRGYGDGLPLERWLGECVWPAEAKLDRNIICSGSMLGLLEMIAGGTTSFADMYFFEDEIAKSCSKAGLRGFLGFSLMDRGTPDVKAENMFSELETFLNKWEKDPLINPVVAPHSCYTCSPEILRKAAILSEKHNLLLHTHCQETKKEVYDCQKNYGKRPVQLFKECNILKPGTILAHCCWMTGEDILEIFRSGAAIAHNPVSNAKLATGMVPDMSEVIQRGITCGLGTDGAASNNTLDMFETMKFASLLQKHQYENPLALNAQQTLDMATLNGVKAIGLETDLGSIEEGKLADLILIDLKKPHLIPLSNLQSSLVYACKASDVCCTIVNGKLLMHDGEFFTLDPDRVLDEASEAKEKLVSG